MISSSIIRNPAIQEKDLPLQLRHQNGLFLGTLAFFVLMFVTGISATGRIVWKRDKFQVKNVLSMLFLTGALSALPHAALGQSINLPPGGNNLQAWQCMCIDSGTHTYFQVSNNLETANQACNLFCGGADFRVQHYVPTLTEWGMIIFTLLLLTAGTLFAMRSQARTGGSGRAGGIPELVFVPGVFIKALALTGLLALAGFAFGAWLSSGPPDATDVIGTLVSAPVFAYLLHLLMIFKRE